MSQTATTASLEKVVVNEVSDIRTKEMGTLFVRMVRQRGPNRQNNGGGGEADVAPNKLASNFLASRSGAAKWNTPPSSIIPTTKRALKAPRLGAPNRLPGSDLSDGVTIPGATGSATSETEWNT